MNSTNQDLYLCPRPISEFKRIEDDNAILASTGCTSNFCQAARLIHTDETRVGEHRSLQVIEKEAEAFLREYYRGSVCGGAEAFNERLHQVLEEINVNAVVGVAGQQVVKFGGNWVQTYAELEFGVRRAWRNSRKCIMRSHCEELKLVDLRNVTSSVQMGTDLVEAVLAAFNGGNIQPTAILFPPRTVTGRGPMIWNHQILQFAGYEESDGSILGDPMNVDLTKAIIEIGWNTPEPRTRWDLLPLVTMAEGDSPAILELPESLRRLVEIRHPYYTKEFEDLDLRWVAFPALSRLGFDVGGVQYTASPFIGWFMDAEIGVRNLADKFRYNVLPAIVRVLGYIHGKLSHSVEELDELPEYEQLAMLSRAQAELNYAVNYSFLQAKITMSDTLTASMKWCKYDDDFKQKHGYRLPADPYWLSPPQGSIIPLWHRGGAPNYQPKPMICRHLQDPIKAWRREGHRPPATLSSLVALPVVAGPCEASKLKAVNKIAFKIENLWSASLHSIELQRSQQCVPRMIRSDSTYGSRATESVAIFHCSTGPTAAKLASKLHKWISGFIPNCPGISLCPSVRSLNSLQLLDIHQDTILLLIVSSTGKGEIPADGSALENLYVEYKPERRPNDQRCFRFAVFGNGDSRYSNTYNGAAIKVNAIMERLGGRSLTGGVFNGDTAMVPLPIPTLQTWWNKLQACISNVFKPVKLPESDVVMEEKCRQNQLLASLQESIIMRVIPEALGVGRGSWLITLNVNSGPIERMSCVQILPSNARFKVDRVLHALNVDGSSYVHLHTDGEDPTHFRYLTEFVDLELPFLSLTWLESVKLNDHWSCTNESLRTLSVIEVLEYLHSRGFSKQCSAHDGLQQAICYDMPLLRTRNFSIASSTLDPVDSQIREIRTQGQIDIMAKAFPGGRFSDCFLRDSPAFASLKYRIVDSVSGPCLRRNYLAPFVIVATGPGFGPVRALLEWRVANVRKDLAEGQSLPNPTAGFSLFLGFKESDLDLIVDVLNEAMEVNLVDLLDIVISNPEKGRVYDCLPLHRMRVRDKVFRQKGMVFVCTNRAAAESTKRVFGEVLGGNIWDVVGTGKYVEEVF